MWMLSWNFFLPLRLRVSSGRLGSASRLGNFFFRSKHKLANKCNQLRLSATVCVKQARRALEDNWIWLFTMRKKNSLLLSSSSSLLLAGNWTAYGDVWFMVTGWAGNWIELICCDFHCRIMKSNWILELKSYGGSEIWYQMRLAFLAFQPAEWISRNSLSFASTNKP